MEIRKYLSASGLFKLVHVGFEKIKDFRADDQQISLVDALMSAFAMFSLKDPSLLAFDKRRSSDGNLKRLYKIKTIPCDTQMRTILDEVDPEGIRPAAIPVMSWFGLILNSGKAKTKRLNMSLVRSCEKHSQDDRYS